MRNKISYKFGIIYKYGFATFRMIQQTTNQIWQVSKKSSENARQVCGMVYRVSSTTKQVLRSEREGTHLQPCPLLGEPGDGLFLERQGLAQLSLPGIHCPSRLLQLLLQTLHRPTVLKLRRRHLRGGPPFNSVLFPTRCRGSPVKSRRQECPETVRAARSLSS